MELKQRQLHEGQKKIASDTHRFRVANCGRKFGKTVLSEDEISTCGYSKDGIQIAYIAPTYGEARDIMWNPLKKRTTPIQAIKPNETRLELELNTQDKGRSIIYLKGWESIESLRGMQFDFLVLDEVAKYRNFWTGWHEVLRPTLTPRKGTALFISTPKGFNHFYDLYNLQYENDDYTSFHFTSYDNPHIDPEELDKARKEMTEDRFAQEYLADFRKQEGLVYKEFIRDKHVYSELDDFDKEMLAEPRHVIAGVDFGFTNPAAVLKIKIDSLDNWWIVEEWYKTGKTEAQIAEYIAAQKFNYVYPDPESPSAIKELTDRKVNVREVLKGKDSIQNGINKVRELLKSNKLKIHKDCKNTIAEFETYAYPDSKDGKNEQENPIDLSNHSLDALRYCVMMLFGQGDETISVYKPLMESGKKEKIEVFIPKW